MKLDTVILASNDNPDYLDFWPIVSEAWSIMGIEPILIYTGKSKQNLKGNIIEFDSKNFDSAFVAQNIRLLYPAMLNNKNCIISDIDLLPLSKRYFVESIEKFKDNSFIVYRPDAGLPKNMISIMWNAANSDTWNEIFKSDTIDKIYKKLNQWYSRKYSIRGKAWYTDQIKLQKYLNKFQKRNKHRVVLLDDNNAGFNRFNRTKIDYHLSLLNNENTLFSDFHMPRPYNEHEELIKMVFNKNKINLKK